MKHRGDAEERRAGRLVELADAAVVVWEDVEAAARLRAKGVRMYFFTFRSSRIVPR